MVGLWVVWFLVRSVGRAVAETTATVANGLLQGQPKQLADLSLYIPLLMFLSAVRYLWSVSLWSESGQGWAHVQGQCEPLVISTRSTAGGITFIKLDYFLFLCLSSQ